MHLNRPRTLVVLLGCSAVFTFTTHALAQTLSEIRTITGEENNQSNIEIGSAGIPLLRIATKYKNEHDADYGDKHDSPSGSNRPNPRVISNLVVAQNQSVPNSQGATNFVWQWGQFIDHDLDLTPAKSPAEPFNVLVPTGDPFFDPGNTGTVLILMNRSTYEHISGIRQQLNMNTAFIDGSQVYGSDETRAARLRAFDGLGSLLTSEGNLLPRNTATNPIPNQPDNSPNFFVAGDVRANEQIGLTVMHTLFVREHNYWSSYFADTFALDDDEAYELARAFVGAEIQKITYSDWLPIILGPNGLSIVSRYRPDIDASIKNVFSTAAFRFGHSMLTNELMRLDDQMMPIPEGSVTLAEAFFAPQLLQETDDVDPFLRGLAAQMAEEVDPMIVDGVRNFLFGPPGAGGSDLASLNIQRGRDHGLPTYNAVRIAYGLPKAKNFADVTTDTSRRARLAAAYPSMDLVDLWVGGLCEDHVPGALVGPTFRAIIADQFMRLRDGDRFFYTRYLPAQLLAMVDQQSLATIIRRNTSIGDEIQDDVFHVAP